MRIVRVFSIDAPRTSANPIFGASYVMTSQTYKKLSAVTLIIAGVALTIGSFAYLALFGIMGFMSFLVKPYLGIGLLFGFVFGLYIIGIGSDLFRDYFETSLVNRLSTLIRWLFAAPFLYHLSLGILQYVQGVISGSHVISFSNLAYLFLFFTPILCVFLWPEICKFAKYLRLRQKRQIR
ncbi:hypothetical protein [Methyloglobulus sp.]|uniref:hypothetical protein n=1 Tax=Methyloglobulus sp. TaxID=2518622 RepID=UPI0032B82F9F